MIKFAIIGTGRIGHVHAMSISSHPDAELTLIANPVPSVAERVARSPSP